MAQHFLLSAEARTLSLASIYKGGEDAAYGTFCRMRWAETEGAPVCPRCGGLKHYDVKGRRKFKCAGCAHQFSVTSGTIFASRKMAFTDLCAAIVLCVNAVKGLSALQLGRDIDCQYKTAFVLAHKIREALASEVEGMQLAGEVEIDGAYFGGKVRPANNVESRKDRRKAENQNGERRVVMVLRERDGATKTFVADREAEGVALAVDNVAADATVYADEAKHWDALHGMLPDRGPHQPHRGLFDRGGEHQSGRVLLLPPPPHGGRPAPPRLGPLPLPVRRRGRLEGGQPPPVERRRLPPHRPLALASPVSRQWKGYWERNEG